MTATELVPPAAVSLTATGKVRVGPSVSIVFEERQTLWLRMQELIRFARKSGTGIDRQLDWYRRLMPEPGRWPAAVWIGRPGSRATPDLSLLRAAVSTARIELHSSAGHVVPAVHLPHRHTDRLVGLIGWVEFRSDPVLDPVLSARSLRWHLRIDADGYTHRSEPLRRTAGGFITAIE